MNGQICHSFKQEEITSIGNGLFSVKKLGHKYVDIINSWGQSHLDNTLHIIEVIPFGHEKQFYNDYFNAIHYKSNDDYALVSDGIYWGAVNAMGELVIPIKYKTLSTQEDRTFLSPTNTINDQGHIVVSDKDKYFVDYNLYDSASILGDGLIKVVKDSYCGVINAAGNIIIPLEYKNITGYFKQKVIVVTSDSINKSGVIDLNNNVLVDFSDYSLLEINNYFIKYSLERYPQTYGALSLNGNTICDSYIYTEIQPFNDILIKVKRTTYDGDRWGLIDFKGNIILPVDYDFIGSCVVYGAIIVKQDDASGFIDVTGKVLIEPKYDKVFNFVNGFAIVGMQTRDGKRYGVINSTYKEIIPCKYEAIKYSKNENVFKTRYYDLTTDGRIIVYEKGKKLFLRKEYDLVSKINTTVGIYLIVKRNLNNELYYGLIDFGEEEIIPCIYQYISKLYDYIFLVKKGNKVNLINIKDNRISKNEYSNAWSLTDKLFLVEEKRIIDHKSYTYYGCIDILFNEVVKTKFDYIGLCIHGISIIINNGKWGILNLETFKTIYIENISYLTYTHGECLKFNIGGNFDVNKNTYLGGHWGLIDLNGKILLDCVYDNILDVYDDIATTKKDNKWGFTLLDGTILVPHDYNGCLWQFKNKVGTLIKDHIFYNFDKNGNLLDTIEDDDLYSYIYDKESYYELFLEEYEHPNNDPDYDSYFLEKVKEIDSLSEDDMPDPTMFFKHWNECIENYSNDIDPCDLWWSSMNDEQCNEWDLREMK